MFDPALAALVVELFRAIHTLAGYPEPTAYPDIHVLPHGQLEARVCPAGCLVKAFYVQGEGVFVDQALDVEHDLQARSILLHELVHYVQLESSRFDSLPECQAWHAREIEAYRIQNEYLWQKGGDGRRYMPAMARRCN
jgi:hypothetical protein